MVQTLAHPISGAAMQFIGNPFKYEAAATLAYPPKLGAHTAEVLTSVCGYDQINLQHLQSQGAIAIN